MRRGASSSHDRRTFAKFSHFEFVNTRNRLRLKSQRTSPTYTQHELCSVIPGIALRPLSYVIPLRFGLGPIITAMMQRARGGHNRRAGDNNGNGRASNFEDRGCEVIDMRNINTHTYRTGQ